MGKMPDVYKRFFVDCVSRGDTHILCQGGRRSAKTQSTFRFLDIIGARMGGIKILVACYQFPSLQKTMEDFTDSLGVTINGNFITGYSARTTNDVVWQFCNFDSREKAQGTAADFMFVNEAIQFPAEKSIVETLIPSIRYCTIYNYNPTKRSFLDKYVKDDGSNLLRTTWKDNPYLTTQQIAEFEAMKERAQRPNATRHDIYQYQVYYLGNYANMVGAVFGNVEHCSVADYRNIPAEECFGLDFGFATDGDPTVLVGLKVFERKIYVHEYIYQQGLTSDIELGERMLGCGITYATVISADYGGNGKGRIRTLRTADNGRWEGDLANGFAIMGARKTGIIDGLSQMLAYDGVVITDTSVNTTDEYEGYTLDENNKTHGADHAIDASRYAFQYAIRMA